MTTGSTGEILEETSTVDHTSQMIHIEPATDQMTTSPHTTRIPTSDYVSFTTTATHVTEQISTSKCIFCLISKNTLYY